MNKSNQQVGVIGQTYRWTIYSEIVFRNLQCFGFLEPTSDFQTASVGVC